MCLTACLNTVTSVMFLIATGRAFHSHGSATEKALSTNFVLVWCMSNSLVFAARSLPRPGIVEILVVVCGTGRAIWHRQLGHLPTYLLYFNHNHPGCLEEMASGPMDWCSFHGKWQKRYAESQRQHRRFSSTRLSNGHRLYYRLENSYIFIPLAFKMYGLVNAKGTQFLQELGHRLRAFLFQCILITLQWFNTIAYTDTYTRVPELET